MEIEREQVTQWRRWSLAEVERDGERMGQEAIEPDSGGRTMQSMVKGNVGGLELVGDDREGRGEGREEGKLEVSLAMAEDKAQVRAKPLAKGEVKIRGKDRVMALEIAQ